MRVVPAGARVARGAVKAGRTDLRTVRLRGSAPALSATQSRSDEARPDGDWRQRRGLLRTKGVADGALVADPLSRVVLSTRRSRTVADDEARRVGNLAESISHQPGYRLKQLNHGDDAQKESSENAEGRSDEGAHSRNSARDFSRARLRGNDDARNCREGRPVARKCLLLLSLEGVSDPGVLPTPARRASRRGAAGAGKERLVESTPADGDAAADRSDESVSPVCGRAVQDGGASGESVESVFGRVGSGAAAEYRIVCQSD